MLGVWTGVGLFLAGACIGAVLGMLALTPFWWTCERCGAEFPRDWRRRYHPNYCAECGAKARRSEW